MLRGLLTKKADFGCFAAGEPICSYGRIGGIGLRSL